MMLSDLYRIRVEKRMSQQRLARLSGVAKSAIAQIKNGKSTPRMDTVWHLASALNMSPADLFIELCKGEDFAMTREVH